MNYRQQLIEARRLARQAKLEVKSDVNKSDWDNRKVEDDLSACMTMMTPRKSRSVKN